MGLTLASAFSILNNLGASVLDDLDELGSFILMELVLHFRDPGVELSGLLRLEVFDRSRS